MPSPFCHACSVCDGWLCHLAGLSRLALLARLVRRDGAAFKECGARLLGKLEPAGALGTRGNYDAVRHAVCRHVALVAALGAANKHGRLHGKAGLVAGAKRQDKSGQPPGLSAEKKRFRRETLRKSSCVWQGLGQPPQGGAAQTPGTGQARPGTAGTDMAGRMRQAWRHRRLPAPVPCASRLAPAGLPGIPASSQTAFRQACPPVSGA